MYLQRLSPEELVTYLAAIVDSCDDAIVARDNSGTITTWNPAASRLFGYTAEEMLGQSVFLIVPPDLFDEERANLEKVGRGETVGPYPTQRFRKGGKHVDVWVRLTPTFDTSGRVIGSSLIVRELAASQGESAALARLAAIIESSDDAILAKDLSGVVTDWNAAAERMFGYSAAEIVGRSILTIIPPELQNEEPVALAKLAAGERVEHYQTQRLHKSGQRIDVSLAMSPIRDAAGRVIGVSKTVRDITDRRRAADARLMLAAIVESSDDAIISKNLDGIITSWNAAAERLFGYKPEEIVGHSVLRLIPRELHYEEPIILGKLRRGERIEHFETRRVKKNGEVIDISLTVSPIKDENGHIVGASKIVRDISERKAAEAALIEKEKLAATGRLAATLAHEVNNPLESIMNLSYIIASNPALPEDLRSHAELLLKEVHRAGDITRQTLSFYRSARMSSEVNIEETIEHVLGAKRKKFAAKNITVTKQFDSSVLVKGFAGELRQVFDNIVENAIDAVPRGGAIRIRTRSVGQNGSEKLVVSVCDNGSGIAPDVRRRVFEPFFTTKLSSGSGVGLWVSRGIVQKHRGSIRVRSRQEGHRSGSVFTVTLPGLQNAAVERARTASLHVA